MFNLKAEKKRQSKYFFVITELVSYFLILFIFQKTSK
jgi:hypothetical protein